MPYDPLRDFAPVALVTKVTEVLVVTPKLGIKSVKELIALAKEKPGAVSFASTGIGSPPHLAQELLDVSANVKFLHVPYRGAAPALTDLLGGQVQVLAADLPVLIAQIQAGALVPIGNELQSAAAALKSAVDWVVPAYGKASRAAHAASVPYLRLWGLVAGGWQLARGAQVAPRLLAENKGDATFYRGKITTARFYAECLLPQAAALARAITLGSESVLALSDEQF